MNVDMCVLAEPLTDLPLDKRSLFVGNAQRGVTVHADVNINSDLIADAACA